jgi:hypothetical protein
MKKIEAGDLLFVWSDGWIGEEIEHITHGSSHVAVFVSEDKLYEAQGGRTLGECDLSFYLNNEEISRLEVWTDPTWTDGERSKVPDVAKKYEGTEYNYEVIGLEFAHFELGLNIDWYSSKGKLDCSEYAKVMGLEFGKVWSKEVHPAPVDLMNGGGLVKKLVLK